MKSDFKRITESAAWLIGMIGVAASLFFSLETNGFFNHNIVSTYVFSTWMSGSLMVYVFCAFPYATVFCEELEHRYVRYSVVRGDLKSYILSKSAIIYLSSFFVMLGGTLLFLLLCRTQIPWMDLQMGNDYESLYAGTYGSVLHAGKPVLYCLLYASSLGLLSGVLSMFAAFCSVYISNRIFALVLPAVLFRILAGLNIGGYNVYVYYGINVFAHDWQNMIFMLLLSVFLSILLAAWIYRGMRNKL